MKIKFYKYHGAGNDFIIIDNRKTDIKLSREEIALFCDRRFGAGADGLMLLNQSSSCDFSMNYYNADGGEASMCGNGGRCIVAFANFLKIIDKKTTFEAIDGLHHANINSINNTNYDISLQMIDVEEVRKTGNNYFLNTGVPHHIEFVNDIQKVNIDKDGREIRYSEKYKSNGGANVNFVEENSDFIKIRTYERGVEGETLACGTGATAAAIAYAIKNNLSNNEIKVKALGGELRISFDNTNNSFSNIILSGPAKFVYSAIWEG
jgi:diaminopimelate epimerase